MEAWWLLRSVSHVMLLPCSVRGWPCINFLLWLCSASYLKFLLLMFLRHIRWLLDVLLVCFKFPGALILWFHASLSTFGVFCGIRNQRICCCSLQLYERRPGVLLHLKSVPKHPWSCASIDHSVILHFIPLPKVASVKETAEPCNRTWELGNSLYLLCS